MLVLFHGVVEWLQPTDNHVMNDPRAEKINECPVVRFLQNYFRGEVSLGADNRIQFSTSIFSVKEGAVANVSEF